MWKIVESFDLPNKLKTFFQETGLNIAIQAEACGPKLNGNRLGLNKPTLFVFNVKNLLTGEWFGLQQITNICQKLNLPMVTVLQTFVFNESIDWLQEIANSVKYSNGSLGEGIVIRPVTPVYSSILGKYLSVKILNQNYKD